MSCNQGCARIPGNGFVVDTGVPDEFSIRGVYGKHAAGPVVEYQYGSCFDAPGYDGAADRAVVSEPPTLTARLPIQSDHADTIAADVNGVLGNQWMGTGCLTAQRVHPLERQPPGVFAGDLRIRLEACVALINAPPGAVFDKGSRRWLAAFARGCIAMRCAAE